MRDRSVPERAETLVLARDKKPERDISNGNEKGKRATVDNVAFPTRAIIFVVNKALDSRTTVGRGIVREKGGGGEQESGLIIFLGGTRAAVPEGI